MILIQQINLLKKNLNKYMINESLKYVFLNIVIWFIRKKGLFPQIIKKNNHISEDENEAQQDGLVKANPKDDFLWMS